jgi:hypothetical protein
MRKRVSHCAFCVDADQRDARRVQALGVSDEQYAGEYLQKGHSKAVQTAGNMLQIRTVRGALWQCEGQEEAMSKKW